MNRLPLGASFLGALCSENWIRVALSVFELLDSVRERKKSDSREESLFEPVYREGRTNQVGPATGPRVVLAPPEIGCTMT